MLRLILILLLSIFSTGQVLAEIRTLDGSGNNLANPTWGAMRANFLRLDPATHYDDGISSPAVLNRPNPRDVSNAVGSQSGPVLDPRHLSDFVWQWGQFIDHDMAMTRRTTHPMHIDVTSPSDPLFPFIPMFRTDFDFETGTSVSNPRQHYNENSSFIDASVVYGSDHQRADALRTHKGGKLTMSEGDLLVRNVIRLENDNPGDEPHWEMFLAGDVRANEHHGLITMHTLFAREHNRIAGEIAAAHPAFSDEQIYQRTRKIIGGIVQHITYNEFLPALTGASGFLLGAQYNATVDATISNEFATAIFRLGHTQVSSSLARIDNDGNVASGGPTSIPDSFFTPSMIDSQEIDYLAKGLASQVQQATDTRMIDELRNQLFGMPDVPSGGLDLLAININRGRDHGLPTLTELQAAVGLPVADSFDDITSDPTVQADLASVYASASDVDLWVGLMAEDALPGSALGFTMQALLLDQFERLMVGDRFFYLWDGDLTAGEIELIESRHLSDLILDNTGITNLQTNVFFVPEPAGIFLLVLGAVALNWRRRR